MNHQDELPLAEVSEIDEAKRQWLQGMRHPVDTVTEPEPAEIGRVHSPAFCGWAAGGARRVSLAALFGCRRGTVSFAGKH